MSTTVVRRLYIYAAAFLGLQVFAAGLRGLIAQLIEPALSSAAIGAADTTTFRLSLNIALVVVGLPLWLLHWWFAQRAAAAPDERRSQLRRLYGYLTLAVAAIACLSGLSALLGALCSGLLWSGADTQSAAAIGLLLVYGAIWAYHWRVFSADRADVEQSGGAATLRRWYVVVVLGAGLLAMSMAAVGVVRELLRAPALGHNLGMSAGELIAGLVIWLPHHLWWRRLVREQSALRADEARSALRQVYHALVVAATAIAALGGLAGVLYRALLAVFGGAEWGSLVTDQAEAIALALVAAPLWNYHRAELAAEARLSQQPFRTAMARRLTGYLMAAVGLVALFFGLGGLLGTQLRLMLAPQTFGLSWREPMSTYLALTVVALPVYAITSQSMERLARGAAAEERTLARRIYLYAALLFGIGATITSLVQLLRLALGALLGASTPDLAVEIGGWVGYSLIGAGLLAYYVVLVRRAGAAKTDLGAGVTVAVLAREPLLAGLLAAIARELPGAVVRAPAAGAPIDAGLLGGADIVIAPLEEALSGPAARAIQAFAGRRLLLATAVPGYELIGAPHSAEAVIREAARALRAALSEPPAAGAAPLPAPV